MYSFVFLSSLVGTCTFTKSRKLFYIYWNWRSATEVGFRLYTVIIYTVIEDGLIIYIHAVIKYSAHLIDHGLLILENPQKTSHSSLLDTYKLTHHRHLKRDDDIINVHQSTRQAHVRYVSHWISTLTDIFILIYVHR